MQRPESICAPDLGEGEVAGQRHALLGQQLLLLLGQLKIQAQLQHKKKRESLGRSLTKDKEKKKKKETEAHQVVVEAGRRDGEPRRRNHR